jgi:tyrosyl-tRNA synthetase
MIEIWRACGMDLTNVEFVWASDFINTYAEKYWFNVLQIALRNSITRIKRCGQIMGREASDELAAAQIFYPCMQCNDVFMLKCDITQLGIDQRKVNMLAREYTGYPDNTGLMEYLGKDKDGKPHKPVILSHHMLAALDGNDKMSKSNPDSAIFMEDTAAEVRHIAMFILGFGTSERSAWAVWCERDRLRWVQVTRKIKKAFCPPQLLTQEFIDEKTGVATTLKNGCMEYVQYLVLPKLRKFVVEMKVADAKTYTDYAEVVADFKSGALHPGARTTVSIVPDFPTHRGASSLPCLSAQGTSSRR